jgi:5-methylcytosine-specific restriction endonuclease McrA
VITACIEVVRRRLPRPLRRSSQLDPHLVGKSGKRVRSWYNSWEWKRVRFAFLKGKARTCQCCGATAADGAKIVVDHIRPIRKFWHLRLDPNLQILCDGCNRGKGSREETDFRDSEIGDGK